MARGEGLRVRLSRIPGETPRDVLRKPLILPAVLRNFGWSEEFLHSEYDTVGAGQFSQPSLGDPTARQLRSVDDVETLTVDWDPPWLVEQGQDPQDVYDELFAIGRSRRGVELLATPKFGPTRPLLRMNVTLRSITAQMREGEPDSIYYVCRIKEWRDASVQRKGEGRGTQLPTTHKLVAADSLYSLSQHYYHSSAGADDIASANGIKGFGKKTPLWKSAKFKVGSKVKIPKITLASVNGGRKG